VTGLSLSADDLDLIAELRRELNRTAKKDLLFYRYYTLQQRLEQLGMAVPPEMRRFLVIANWPRVVVRTIAARQQVRSLILPGEETADPLLRAIWDANNLSAHVKMFNRDRMIYGRAFMSAGANEKNPELPWVRVESPTSLSALVDVKTETMTAAARFYRANPRRVGKSATNITLYEPNMTRHCYRDQHGRWVEDESARDEHGLGAVPIVMHLNRRLSGEWEGESELTDIIPLTDAAGRSLTNLQFAQEAHGVPRMWMTGVAQGDFIDKNGKPIPQFEAYFDAIHTLTKEGAKIGQLTAADLKNFDTALTIYGKQAATVTGFPARYFGLTSVNPPSADGIRAEEAELVRSAEDQNEELGMTLGWTGALTYRLATGIEVPGNRVRVDWFDASTPTVAQREDALSKRRAGGVLSREGYWDELGWSEARKAKERAYFAEEGESDPELAAARALMNANGPA
jgi:hypothetical protein